MARRPTFSKEGVAKLVEDTYRKMKGRGSTDLASNVHDSSDTSQTIALKPKEEVDDSFNLEMKVRCPCGNSLLTESTIRCEDPSCQVWQHISCVIIPQKPLDGIPPVPSQFYCEVCRLARADPFWSIVAHPLLPVKLTTTSIPTDGTNPVQALDKTFHLTRTDRESLSNPGYAVQAWCMLFNDNVPFRMQWPQYADLQVNGLPAIAVSRPNSQLLGANGRDDGPNISQFTRDGINKIYLTGCDARIFCFGVRLVKRRTLQQILSNIPKESDGERFEDALARVIHCIGGAAEDADSDSDLEVVADSFTVNMRCPMSGSRMKTAARFRPCVHMGCFDLETFVEMQQSSRKWQCPVCLKNYSLEHIIVDPYFNRITRMMNSCGEDTTEIEVKPDGSWRVKSDCDRRDLKQWHQPDGSICLSSEGESKHNAEGSILGKLESGSLKIGIGKNSNGVWEVSKHGDGNTISSSERVPENFGSGGLGVIPMCSSATGSGRAGKDASVSQDGKYNFDLAASNSVKLDSISLNREPWYGFATQNANVIVLSDSDKENDMIANVTVHNSGLIDDVYNYDIGPHGNSGLYQDEPGLGVGGSSYLDNFDQANDDFGQTMWQLPSATPKVSSLQLFESHGDGSNTLGNANLINGFMLDPGSVLGPGNSIGHPLRLGGEDPSLQFFLPARPSISEHTQVRNHQDVGNGFGSEDWISLTLGDGVGLTHGDSRNMNGMTSGQQSHHTENYGLGG